MNNTNSLINSFCNGNSSAVEFFSIVTNISQTWDDLIDRDKKFDDAQINAMMWQALISLNENEFFVSNAAQLLPVMKSAIIEWLTANEHEKNHDKDMLKVSYVKRSCVTDIAVFVAYMCGGLEHSLKWAVHIQRAVFARDNFSEYVFEHSGEQ